MLTAVKQALKAIVYPVVGSLKVLVTRPVLSAFRHEVSEWCSVQNNEDQEEVEIRRVRFALNAKKHDGVLEWRGVWTPSRILREVGGEVCYVSIPSDYKDGNFGDWFQHHGEDLKKRASFWHHLSKRNSVENQWSDLERKIDSLEDSERFMEERFREKQRELEEVHQQLERKIDACIYTEANAEELFEEEEINGFAEVEAARWGDKKIEKKFGGEGAVIEDAGGEEDMDVEMLDVQDEIEKKFGGEGAVIEDEGGPEDMDVEMLDVQDQIQSEDNVEEDADEEETDAVGTANVKKGVWIGEGEYKFRMTELIPAQPLSCLNRKYKFARGAFEKVQLRAVMKARSAVIEDEGGPEDMEVDMLEVQDQDHSEDNVEEDTHEVDNVIEQTVAEVSTSVEELKELTVHLEFSSFVQIGSKRRKLEANPEPQENDSLQFEVEVPFKERVQEEGEEEPGEEVQEAELQENDSLQFEVEVPVQSEEVAFESVQGEAGEEPGEVQDAELQENDSLQFEVEAPFEESVQEEGEEEPGEEVQEAEPQENDSLQFEVEVPFEESVQEEGEEEPVEVQEAEPQENDSLQFEVEVPFEESVQEKGEEEPVEVQEAELQENDSLPFEVENFGSGFTTDAAGRVRRFSHRLKGKSRRAYKF